LVSFGSDAPGVKSARFCGDQLRGRLAPELIQKVVRANFGTFRACYEDALRRDASTQGRVATRFVIDREGRVSDASIDPSTTLRDGRALDCIRAAYAKLTFPKPDGGIVTVVYPLIFNPGD
jgi:TonB family protein